MKVNAMMRFIGLFLLPAAMLLLVNCSNNGGPQDQINTAAATGGEERQVKISTDFGDMIVQLSDSTPAHRDNFIQLVEQGFYDSLQFHRVIKEFMIQGGDPDSREAGLRQPLGMGGPGYTVPAEIKSSLRHFKGALAAARQGDQVNPERASSGSQFYLVQGRPFAESELLGIEARMKGMEYQNASDLSYSPEEIERYGSEGGTPFLDNQYTVFGQVISGLEVIDSIAAVPTVPGNRPEQEVRMFMEVIR